jgi:acylphosphatase
MSESPPNTRTKRLHVIVHGRVQGVNFRASTIRKSASLGVTGWVRNLRDGTVEVTAEGQEQDLNALIAFLREGPPAANVTNVDTRWKPATGEFDEFQVRFF